MDFQLKRSLVFGARWISFCICLVISYLAIGMAFLIPGDSVLERMWQTFIFVVLSGVVGLGSGFVFRYTSPNRPKLWTTPPLRLFAVMSVFIAVGFPLMWVVFK